MDCIRKLSKLKTYLIVVDLFWKLIYIALILDSYNWGDCLHQLDILPNHSRRSERI